MERPISTGGLQGYLKKYRNFMSGYARCYVILKPTCLLIQKEKHDKESRIKLPLTNCFLETKGETTEFSLTFTNVKKSTIPKKLFFKAADAKERDLWVSTFDNFLSKLNTNNTSPKLQGDSNQLQQNSTQVQQLNYSNFTKDTLYEAFSSKLFVDECDLDNKLQAYNEVLKMFHSEADILIDLVKTLLTEALEQDKSQMFLKKVCGLKNLGKTMSDLVKNIVGQIDESREQMFRIVESIAVREMENKQTKKGKNKKQQQQIQQQQIKQQKIQSPKKTENTMITQQQKPVITRGTSDKSEREQSSILMSQNLQSKGQNHSLSSTTSFNNHIEQNKKRKISSTMDFGEDDQSEEDEDDDQSDSSISQASSILRSDKSLISGDSDFEFGIEDEEEMFEDAHDEIIQQNEQVIKSKRVFIQDVAEERITLPHLRPPNFKVSVWQVLKDLVGKDLTKVSMPVYFNEPISLNQRMAESLEYIDLLENAALEPNPNIRIGYIAAFISSKYCSIVSRTTKPFNSLLGETYELVTSKYRFISEQVSHHPPITAYHCESNYYEMFAQARTSMKFNGRYLRFDPKDRIYVTLKLQDGTKEYYSTTLPSTSVHNLIIGKMYVDVHGKSLVLNHNTMDSCDVEWKERGWSGKNAHAIMGIVKNAQGKQTFKLQGKFTETITMTNLENSLEEVEIYKMNEKGLEKHDHMYNFSWFTLQLNYCPPSLKEKLAPTDSRLRPDQRALEMGDTETAIKEKHRLEEAQRARRKEHEKKGTNHIPAYFDEIEVPHTKEKIFQFNCQYWEDRSNKEWSRVVKVFE